jgi:hypothetical protein
MDKNIYLIIRYIFGLYILWLGLVVINQSTMYENHVKHSFTNFEKDVNMLYFGIMPDENIPHTHKNSPFHIMMENFNKSSAEIIYLISFSLILGGFMCLIGHSTSFMFMFAGLLLDLIFIHNLYYFRDEKMKVNVLKILAIFGAVLHIA